MFLEVDPSFKEINLLARNVLTHPFIEIFSDIEGSFIKSLIVIILKIN